MKTGLSVNNMKLQLIPVATLNILYIILFFISIIVKCFYYQFTTRINIRPFLSTGNLYMLAASICILILLYSLVLQFCGKSRYTVLCVLHFLLSALLIADTNFYRYYNSILTIPVILHIDVRLLSSVDQSILSLFKIKDIIYFIDIPFVVTGAVILNICKPVTADFKKRAKNCLLIGAAALAVFIPLYIKADIGSYFYNSSYVAKSLGILYAHADTTRNYIKEIFRSSKFNQKDIGKVNEFFVQKEKPGGSVYNGAAKGKNLIIIQVEALQQFVINRKICGREITPNLNRLIKYNVYFDNFYFQVAGGNTSDAEFLCNTSLYPARDGAVYYRYPNNTYFSLPKTMKKLGYNTYALHAFSAQFWNRTKMYKALEFGRFLNSDDYVKDEFAGWKGDALSDSSFFKQSLDKIDTRNPFYAFIITLSSHHPFTSFTDYPFDTGEFEGQYLGNYLKAVNYADKCLGEFLTNLKEKGLYDKSLIVIYGDHSAVPKLESAQLMQFLGKKYNDTEWIKLQKIPLIICCQGLKPGEIDTVGGEIDISPTIGNLLGVKSAYNLGKDLFNSGYGYAVFRDGSVITDNYIYLNNRREVYDAKTGKKLPNKNYRQQIDKYLKELEISDIILETDAFKYFSDKNEILSH